MQVHVDDMAERITALGGTARGTATVAASASTLPEYPLDIHSGSEHVRAVSTALAAFGKVVRAAIAELEDGEWEGETWSDGFEEPILIKAKVTRGC